jgi:hypothetical protein
MIANVSIGVPQMTPEVALIFALFRIHWKNRRGRQTAPVERSYTRGGRSLKSSRSRNGNVRHGVNERTRHRPSDTHNSGKEYLTNNHAIRGTRGRKEGDGGATGAADAGA